MRSNEAAFQWLLPTSGNADRRDYPMRGESLILSMTDVIWSPPYPHDSDHSHNCMEIGMCLEGGGTIRIGVQEERAFSPGTVVIVPEGVRHSQQCMGEETSRWRYIAVDEAMLLRETPVLCREAMARLIGAAGVGGVFLHEQEMTQDIVWLIQKMFDLKCRYSEEATAQLEAMLLLILTRVAREPQGEEMLGAHRKLTHQPIEPALLYIAEQYHNETKVTQLARCCAMSESHFRKVFVQLMGETPVEYLNRYRIARAANMIRSGSDASFSHIAEACGFTSIATFNRNFLRYTGQTPSELKKESVHPRLTDAGKIVQNG